MKLKLPILVGGIFILSSLPFIFGLLQPSIHERGYSALYVTLNIPAPVVISGAADRLDSALFKTQDLFTSNMITLALVFLFWVLSSFILGSIFDEIRRRQRSGELNKPRG